MTNCRLECRGKVTVNNDPQRRCYNGCHASTLTYWSDWEVYDYNLTEDKAKERLEFWQDLNEYAVSQRGKGALKQFRIVKT